MKAKPILILRWLPKPGEERKLKTPILHQLARTFPKLFPVIMLALAGALSAQTNTPTPSNTPTATNTPTNTFTPSNTPTSTPTPTATPAPVTGSSMTLTVKDTQTDSRSIFLPEGVRHQCMVYVPATIDGTATIRVAPTRAAITAYGILSQPGGTAVPLVVLTAQPTPEFAAAQLWIHLSTAATADRAFSVLCNQVK